MLASCIFSIGFGVRAPLLAVASTYISSSFDTGKLYTMFSMTDAFAHIPGEPFIQAVWAAAIYTGGSWLVLHVLVILVSKKLLCLKHSLKPELILLGSLYH